MESLGKEEKGGGELYVGTCGTTRRPTSRATKTKQAVRDVASCKKLTLETVTRGKK